MVYLLGFDPGRDKCGVAVIESNSEPDQGNCREISREILREISPSVRCRVCQHQILLAPTAVVGLQALCDRFPITTLVLGDGTTAKGWQQKISTVLSIPVVMVNERNSTLEARDRYWQMFPPRGLQRFLPQSLRSIDRPIDDIVAILLVERYLSGY